MIKPSQENYYLFLNEDGEIIDKMTSADLAVHYGLLLSEKSGERITSFAPMQTK